MVVLEYLLLAQAYGPFVDSITGKTTTETKATTESDNDKFIIHGKTYVVKFDNATAGSLTLEQSTATHPSYIPPGYLVTNPPKSINAGQLNGVFQKVVHIRRCSRFCYIFNWWR